MIIDLTLKVDAYIYRKHWTNEQDAMEWLREVVDRKFYQPLSQVAYDQKCYELLWDFIPVTPPPGQCEECVWLSRAAAYLSTHSSNNEHLQTMKEYFSSSKNTIYFQFGRYLLDLIQEKDLFPFVKTPKDRCLLGYYCGLKAQAEGRYYDASDWFRVSIETRRDVTSSYKWAYRQLQSWNTANRTLDILARETL
jgi:hypothetical protein